MRWGHLREYRWERCHLNHRTSILDQASFTTMLVFPDCLLQSADCRRVCETRQFGKRNVLMTHSLSGSHSISLLPVLTFIPEEALMRQCAYEHKNYLMPEWDNCLFCVDQHSLINVGAQILHYITLGQREKKLQHHTFLLEKPLIALFFTFVQSVRVRVKKLHELKWLLSA